MISKLWWNFPPKKREKLVKITLKKKKKNFQKYPNFFLGKKSTTHFGDIKNIKPSKLYSTKVSPPPPSYIGIDLLFNETSIRIINIGHCPTPNKIGSDVGCHCMLQWRDVGCPPKWNFVIILCYLFGLLPLDFPIAKKQSHIIWYLVKLHVMYFVVATWGGG